MGYKDAQMAIIFLKAHIFFLSPQKFLHLKKDTNFFLLILLIQGTIAPIAEQSEFQRDLDKAATVEEYAELLWRTEVE